jgi:hypothetical protein
VGSRRQVRGAIVALLRTGSVRVGDLPARTGFAPERVDDALGTLLRDGLVATRRGRASLAS